MYKKFLSALVLVFAFLFLNVSFNSFDIKADVIILPDNVSQQAGKGRYYWATVNYGDKYIGDSTVTINIQREAIENKEVEFIVITETGYLSDTYFQRNVSANFSSTIEYTFENKNCGPKSVTIFLLRELAVNPTDELIVDKIIVNVDQKNTICGLNEDDFEITQETHSGGSIAKVKIGLKDKSLVNDYALEKVTYRLKQNGVSALNAIKEDSKENEFYFETDLNGEYEIIVTDAFDCTKTLTFTVSGLSTPPIYIRAIPQKTELVNYDYVITIEVYQFSGSGEIKLNAGDLTSLTYKYEEEESVPIKDSMQIIVKQNGLYTVYAKVKNSEATLEILVDNIDKEAPFLSVSQRMEVYTESLDLFDPRKEVFFSDNVTSGDWLAKNVQLNYYIAPICEKEIDGKLRKVSCTNGDGRLIRGEELTESNFRDYLYTVRDLIVKYTVTDEAGNTSYEYSDIISLDNTKPIVETTINRMMLYINDPYPAKEYLLLSYGIVVKDNSLYPGSGRDDEIQFTMDYSELPVDKNGRLNELGNYRIFLSAIDGSNNVSDEIVLNAEVRQRVIKIEADANQYILYGDRAPEDVVIKYSCLVEEFIDGKIVTNRVDCSTQLLEGDYIIGQLYVINAKYVNSYTIYYDRIKVPNQLYYLDYGDVNIQFNVYPRKVKVVADTKSKYYKEEDPELTYKWGKDVDDSTCTTSADTRKEGYVYNSDYTKEYRCDLVAGDTFKGNLARYEGLPEDLVEPEYKNVTIWRDPNDNEVEDKEYVWFDEEGKIASRPIYRNTLDIIELDDGGFDNNYDLEYEKGKFYIYVKSVSVTIKDAEKIYGKLDPDFEISSCEIVVPDFNGEPIYKDCLKNDEYKTFGITMKRNEENQGENVGTYKINGYWTNKNYLVTFKLGELTINKRYIALKVEGDKKEDGSYTGKYKIYYEDEIPDIKVYDGTKEVVESEGKVYIKEDMGIAYNEQLNINDSIFYGKADIYSNCNGTCAEHLVTDYDRVGIYIIRRGSITLADKDGNGAENNYDIIFIDGQLEVIKKEIQIKIIEGLSKIYGDNDAYFSVGYLESHYRDQDYIILEQNQRFIIEITNRTDLANGQPYIPRDNEKMKYFLKREEGIFAGIYAVSIDYDKLEGCENYDVYLLEDYKYTINRKPITITIRDSEIIYRQTNLQLTYTTNLATLPYEDQLTGTPGVDETSCYIGEVIEGLSHCNVREIGYSIGKGSITILDKAGINDVSDNYVFTIEKGTLMILKREILITALGGEKEYGDQDPVLEFRAIFRNEEPEELPTDQYAGRLGRQAGEIPGVYEINEGDLVILHLENGVVYENYEIIGFDFNNKFHIVPREITIMVKNKYIKAIYGDVDKDYFKGDSSNDYWQIKDGKTLANLYVEGIHVISDKMEGNLVIENAEVDEGGYLGVGTYTVNCNGLYIVDKNGNPVPVGADGYYNITYENGTLEIIPRHITIIPNEGLSKVYGEDDPDLGPGVAYHWNPSSLMLETDKVVGNLVRLPNVVNGVNVYEEIGTYKLSVENIQVITASGKPNYTVGVDTGGSFVIKPRPLTIEPYACKKEVVDGEMVCTITNTVEYGDEFELNYKLGGDGLANNSKIGVVDTITGGVSLSPNYNGVGEYEITSENLTVSNASNYKISFITGKKLYVIKKKIIITPLERYLHKVYGESDPEEIKFEMSFNAPYVGRLEREPGENVGTYKILMATLDFGSNYDVTLVNSNFVIDPRVIEVTALDTGKIYSYEDPALKYTYTGTLIGSDNFSGALEREKGEEVGVYEIKQGTLALTNNYKIDFTPGIFTISYAEFTDIIIYSKNPNNKYQVKGQESQVELYARFNPGADETHLRDVEWKVVKTLPDGSLYDWQFIVDSNNEISFFPSDSIGRYTVSASYGGITAYYEVVVELSTIINVYIEHDSGEINQILGKTGPISYKATVSGKTDQNTVIRWLINDVEVTSKKLSESNTFTYLPKDKGDYKVQAQVSDKISTALYFYVKNNNPPLITLNTTEECGTVCYIEAKSGKKYIEPGAVAIDDIDGEVEVHISGYVDEDVKNTYYIKYDAIDSHGNHAISVYRQVIVRDTTPPVVTLNGDKEIILSYGKEYTEYGATAWDNYDGEVEVTINNPIVPNKVGTFEVVYYAYDGSNNRGSAIRTVRIVDDVPPTITLVGDEIVYVEVHHPFEDPGALVEDNVDGQFYITATSFYQDGRQIRTIDTSKLGIYYAYYEYTDSSGNSGVGKVRTIIVRDTTPPVITLNGVSPHIVRYSYPTINYVEPGAVAIDNYDGNVEVIISGEIGRELGTYNIYYDAVDSHGNKAETVVRQVVVVDVENPVIHFLSACPQYMTIEALYEKYDAKCNQPGYGIWVEDDYIEDIEGIQKRVVVSGTVDDTTKGTYIITYDVKDMAGNAAVTLKRYVRVVDTTAPVIKLNGDKEQIVEVFEKYEELGVTVEERYDTYHSLETKVTISHNINVSKLGEYKVTYNAVDSSGNKAIPVTRTVYVKDTKPPVITIQGKNPYIIERGERYRDDGATAIDNYDGQIRSIAVSGVPSGMIKGEFEVTYRAVDSSGNVGIAKRRVIVQDTIPPIVLGVENNGYYRKPVSIHFIPTVGTDEVLTGWLNGVEITSPHYVEEEGTYDLLVKDDAGNKTEIRFYIDRTPPVILGVKNNEYTNREIVEVYANEKVRYFGYKFQNGEWETSTNEILKFEKEGIYYVYAVDMAGNECDTVKFIIDRTMPTYNLTGVLNKGITNSDVQLITEAGASVVINAEYSVKTTHTFNVDGYYQISIRDLAGNTVNLQFVINKTNKVNVNNQTIIILGQHNAIDKIRINGNYPRSSGYMVAMPLVEGGFKYISGKLFSEAEYQKLLAGDTVEFNVSSTDDTYMYVAFVVESSELNKFGTQTVEGDKDESNLLLYIVLIIAVILIVGFFFVIFLKRRRREEDEEEEDEIIVDDY